jgi:hypothetical protein
MYIHIEDEHRDAILARVKKLFDRYHGEIDTAYTENENEITVNFTAKMSPGKPNGIKIITGISFTTGKIKDSLEDRIDDGRQRQLDFNTPAPAQRPR